MGGSVSLKTSQNQLTLSIPKKFMCSICRLSDLDASLKVYLHKTTKKIWPWTVRQVFSGGQNRCLPDFLAFVWSFTARNPDTTSIYFRFSFKLE